ncbi:trans-aconitate 2-methyltransferase [Planomicrobium sp. CPCC 101110]|uniref:class I SAM-dependent methyltransferase n=1 Tax=Planomicrobium sp. CPCC 101110 TaxID=2599619 RepID=UPI0011B4606C|nr:class I SAM-dependent methyltransferase [Planomicrobium sp. CPCC 101110]TWT27281.1 methyltransferase domain-containing protein [Planomicrobium sp. CPCC 101110]
MEKSQRTKDPWNATLYDQNHSFVSEYGNDLIELLAPKQGEKILDLGCGTGDLAKKLSDGGVDVAGVDNSSNMIAEALGKYPEIRFLVRDATDLGYSAEFDAVFSNATLHWVKQPKQALSSIFQSLKPKGRFVAEFGGKGNVQTITEEVIHQLKEEGISHSPDQFPWYFPSIGEYAPLMEEAGFKVIFAQHFDRPTPLNGEDGLKNWIEMFGGYMFEKVDEDTKNNIITKAERNLKSVLWEDGSWTADYKRIRVIGIKE